MSEQERLARAYRRLLLAYPRRVRAARGTEIVSTLLDAASPGRYRPTRAEAVDLLWGGLRCRFSVPRGVGPVLVALVVAVLSGALAGAAGARLAWDLADPMPAGDEAVAVARTVLPRGFTAPPIGDSDPLRGLTRWSTNELDAGSFGRAAVEWVQISAELWPSDLGPKESSDALAADIRQRLTEAGWRVGPLLPETAPTFWAHRDGLLVRVLVAAPVGVPPFLLVTVHREEPTGVVETSFGALGLGLVGGWLGASWFLWRRRGQPAARRAVLTLVGVPGLVVLGLLLVAMLPEVLRRARDGDGWSATDSLYQASAWSFAAPLTTLGLVLVAVAGILAARPIPAALALPDTERETEHYLLRYGSRAVAALHLAFGVSWLVVVAVYAVVIGDDREGMLRMEYDPKDIFSGPVVVVWMVVYVVSIIGALVNPGLLALSVPMLVRGRAAVGRRTWPVLLGSAACAAAVGIAWVTGFQSDLLTWLLD